MTDWYKVDAEDVVHQLGIDAIHGLRTEEAIHRVAHYAPCSVWVVQA